MSKIHRGDSERRDFIRMGVDCRMTIRDPQSGDVRDGTCKNLSGNGIMFTCAHDYPVGAQLEVSVIPQTSSTAPLDIVVEVLRCNALPDGGYEVAGEKLNKNR